MVTESITAARLREVLDYDPESGRFTRRITTGRCGRWRIGGLAGSPTGDGYITIWLGRNHYQAHRLAWLWMTGEFPKQQIDHINQNRADNKWSNLREATQSENNCNSQRQTNSVSGFKGVSWNRPRTRRQAEIKTNGKHIFLGYFDTPEAAHAAYIKAAERHHGRFANAGYRHVQLFGRCSLRLRATGGGL